MVLNSKKAKGLGLCSGGLDSILAGVVLREHGVDVTWICFETPFFGAEKAREASAHLSIPLIVRNITKRYLDMLVDPPAGYGQHMNPCLDCHALMFRIAGEVMRAEGYDFLFSGEVAGQRPMSQTRSSLRYVEKHSGFAGYIVRPLSIRLLPETIPEKEGLIDRNGLYDVGGISGRGRKDQMALARRFNITEYPSPAGGCLLTDKNYCRRLKDLFDHHRDYREAELHLLKFGRHLRLDDKTRLIVGRDRRDNKAISRYYDRRRDTLIRSRHVPGPLCVIPGGGNPEKARLAASLCAGYGKPSETGEREVFVITPSGREAITVPLLSPDQTDAKMV